MESVYSRERNYTENKDSARRNVKNGTVYEILRMVRSIVVITAIAFSLAVIVRYTLYKNENIKKDEIYQSALRAFDRGEYQNARTIFSDILSYRDSAEYVNRIDVVLQEKDQNYLRAVDHCNNGAYSLCLDILTDKDMLNYGDAADYIDKASQGLYDEATSAFAAKDYRKCQDILEDIPMISFVYPKAERLQVQVEALLNQADRRVLYDTAKSLYEENDYMSAQAFFIRSDNYEDSSTYLNAIAEIMYDQADAEFQNQNYEECGDALNRIDTSEEWPLGYNKAIVMKDAVREEYSEILCQEATKLCRTDGYSSMCRYLDSKLPSSLLDQSIINQMKEDCNVGYMGLEEMSSSWSGKYGITRKYDVEDESGRKYSFALCGTQSYYDREEAFLVFDVNGKYDYLEATVSVKNDKFISDSATGGILIYEEGTEKLLWSDTDITAQTMPYEIQVPVCGESGQIRIVMYGCTGDNGITPILGNPRLAKEG